MNSILAEKLRAGVKILTLAFGILIYSIALVEYSAHAESDHVLWDAWYTVTINRTVPAQYYNEHVEIKKGKVYFQVSLWKQDEGFINAEQLGEFSENNPEVTPLFYNYHAVERSTENVIDGTVENGKLNVRIKKSGKESPIVKRDMEPHAIFSQFFPLWIAKQFQAGKINGKTPLGFQTILEDNIEVNFVPVLGDIKTAPADEFAKKTKSQKYEVNYHGEHSVWWVDAKGETQKIDLTDQNAQVEKVSKAKAQKFLDAPSSLKTHPAPGDNADQG